MEKVISIVGAGGKTTLVHKLAREYHRSGKGVLVTTTTHMYVEADTDLLLAVTLPLWEADLLTL